MQRQIIVTEDGSSSVSVPGMNNNITYHSIHGAVQESLHIFIRAGLLPLIEEKKYDTIHIFEMGFGTGLNALLTLEQAILHQQKIHYTAVELFPLNEDEVKKLNYPDKLSLQQLHTCDWEKDVVLNEYFTLHKTKQSLLNFLTDQHFNLIYFDAFAPDVQPELWSEEVFKKLFSWLNEDGVLLTYSSKTAVRKALQAAGFSVKKLKGPPHKREIIRAKNTFSVSEKKAKCNL